MRVPGNVAATLIGLRLGNTQKRKALDEHQSCSFVVVFQPGSLLGGLEIFVRRGEEQPPFAALIEVSSLDENAAQDEFIVVLQFVIQLEGFEKGEHLLGSVKQAVSE